MSKSTLTLGSLFSGSGGFELGAALAGIEPRFKSEIEPFAIAVTNKHFPNVKHYGDVSAINGAEIEPVDIITFGSPCQDMSIAGKRAGLDGERSNLFYEAIRIVKEMRESTNGKKPRYIVWENVPGAFSSNKGADFKAVLESICSVKDETVSVPEPSNGKWANAGEILGNDYSAAWRVIDAQYHGVPQRRKRIFLVADFDGGSAGKILFESESVSGYSAESLRAWQGVTATPKESAGAAGFDGYNGNITGDISATLGQNCGMSSGRNGIVLNDQGGSRMDVTEDKTSTLRAKANHPPVVMESAGFCTEPSAKTRSIGYAEEQSPTLRAGTVPATMVFDNHSQDTRYTGPVDTAQTVLSTFGAGGNNQPFVVETPKTLKIRSGCDGGGKGPLVQEDKSATLGTHNDQTVFVPTAYGICSKDSNSMKSANPKSGFYEADTSRTLDGNGGNPSCNQGGMAVLCVDQGGGKSSASVLKDKSPTLATTHGGEPVVCVEKDITVIEGNGSRPSHHGDGYKESDIMYTLNTTERHAVAFAKKSATLSANDGPKGPSSQQLGNPEENFVVSPVYGIDRAAFNQGKNAKFGITIDEEVEPPIVARGAGAVAHPTYSTSKNSHHTIAEEELANTLVASDYKDPPTVTKEPYYIVRRLTPTECARLQGFPDWWCENLGIENPNGYDIAFWRKVFETHRKVVTKAEKPKTDKQIIKWLKNPHSDSAEYKLWGNGVCLNIVYMIMCGIRWAAEKEQEND